MSEVIGATRIERSWTIHAGSMRFGLSTTEYRTAMIAPPTYASTSAAEPRSNPVTRLAGAMLATIGAGTIVGIAVQAADASARSPYVVSVTLPARVTVDREDASPAPPPVRADPRTRIAARIAPPATVPIPPLPQPSASPTPVATPRAAPVVRDTPGDAGEEDMTLSTMAQAIAAASASGQLQQWSDADGLEHGFVVAGPSEGGCRTLSVLIRRAGSDDRVESRRACRDGATSPS